MVCTNRIDSGINFNVHIAIVVTDGASSNLGATLSAASALHASNIYDQVYAVGVSGARMTELEAIASDPSLVFFTTNFDNAAIRALQSSLTQELCNSKFNTYKFILLLKFIFDI